MNGYLRAIVAAEACGVLLFCGTALRGATFPLTLPGLGDLIVVEADPYKEGDTPGNTLRAAGHGTGFWGSTDNSHYDGLWRERAYSTGFDTGYTDLPGATDRVYEIGAADLTDAPALRTTVSGLPAGDHEVFLVYTFRNDGDPSNAGTLAELNGSVSSSSDLYNHTNYDEEIVGAGNVWSTGFASMGMTGPGATGFFVEVLGSPGQYVRTHHLAVAYSYIQLAAQLTCEVNTTTGGVSLRNNSGGPVDVDLYEILSAGGALNPAGWISLQDQDYEGNGPPGDGNGWEELGTPGAGFLGEGYLRGSSVLADATTVNLGNAFDPAVFGVGVDGDLEFMFRTVGGQQVSGIVEYVTGGGLPGDANSDGMVTDLDASILAAHWQQTGMHWSDGDFNADGIVNDADASILAAHWQEGTEGATPTPEPATGVLLAGALLWLGVRRWWRR